jgi:glutamate racemase
VHPLHAKVDASAPLGVFDSGLGGLTVVRALRQALPAEDIVYLGDTARVPYGTKGSATVAKYALACGRHLVARGAKALVIACNTASAVGPEMLGVELNVPVLGVIEPGARAAVAATKTGRIGVLATAGTIMSGAYPRAVAQISTHARVVGQAAPLLVPLAEEGWTNGEVPRLVVRRYIEPLARARVDVVVLGCTHYPLLRDVIEEQVSSCIGQPIPVVDSAGAIAGEVLHFLRARMLARSDALGVEGCVRLLVTDFPRSFSRSAARFLGADVSDVEQVDL